jgi:hypothetical protein
MGLVLQSRPPGVIDPEAALDQRPKNLLLLTSMENWVIAGSYLLNLDIYAIALDKRDAIKRTIC